VNFTKAILFRATAKFGFTLLLALFACSVTDAQHVKTIYTPGTDFAKYKTYAWVNEVRGAPTGGGDPDRILDAQVKEAIDSQMVFKGFTKVEGDTKTDLLVGYQLAIDQEKQINVSEDNLGGWGGWAGWGWGPWWGRFATFSAATSSNYIETFVIGMYDPAVKKLVWIGAAQNAIEPGKEQENDQQRLNKGAKKMLKDFPPERGR